MAKIVIMPKQGLQMTEGTITSWLAKENEPVMQDEPLFEMETDKLSITINAPVSGTLLKILRGEGETVPITEPIAIIGKPGEEFAGLLEQEIDNAVVQITQEPPMQQSTHFIHPSSDRNRSVQPTLAPVETTRNPSAQTQTNQTGAGSVLFNQVRSKQIFITPRAKTLAKSNAIDYTRISGSGPDGLIIERDIHSVLSRPINPVKATPLAKKVAVLNQVSLNHIVGSGCRGKIIKADVLKAKRAEDTDTASAPNETYLPIRGMRRIIADRMAHSLHTAAQATHRVRVDMSKSAHLRDGLKTIGKRVSYNDIVSFATCRALQDYPIMNSEWTEDHIVLKHAVNLGIAVALDNGLIVPVIRNAHTMGLEEIALSTRSLVDKARNRQLKPNEYKGGSFTISNLGRIGLDSFVAVLNPPETGILAVGRIADTPVVNDKREVEVRLMMELTLTYDHRVVDGAPAAQFLMKIKQYLEQPYLLL